MASQILQPMVLDAANGPTSPLPPCRPHFRAPRPGRQTRLPRLLLRGCVLQRYAFALPCLLHPFATLKRDHTALDVHRSCPKGRSGLLRIGENHPIPTGVCLSVCPLAGRSRYHFHFKTSPRWYLSVLLRSNSGHRVHSRPESPISNLGPTARRAFFAMRRPFLPLATTLSLAPGY